MMKVQFYVKKLSDIYSLWNVKFFDYESYNILWEEVYEEKSYYSLRCFEFKTKLPIIWIKLKWLCCNENIYTYMYGCKYMILNNQYYIWWLCKKWKTFNLKDFENIVLIRKRRTVIYRWKAYKFLLWIV